MAEKRPRIAIAIGDPSGIGPEISLKAALDPQVNEICRPVLVGDPDILKRHAAAAGSATIITPIERVSDARYTPGAVNVLAVPAEGPFEFGANGAHYGRATIACARAAIRAALAGEVDAVVAAPTNQTSIAAAGIAFDGYPGFVARETGMNHHDVFLMLCFNDKRIVHTTLHVGVAEAVALITRERVGLAIRAADAALRRLGVANPRIRVSGLNPHAGEGGLFGREEIDIIGPAVADAKAAGIDADGPFGADIMLYQPGIDAFVVMLHDQGHIPAKLLAPNRTAGLSIGSPILFSSVAHGSAFDIAGKGMANPAAMIEAVKRLSGAQ